MDAHLAHFNSCLGWTHALVECAFRPLKRHWCNLTAHLEFTKDDLSWVIVAAYMLHNICETRGEIFHKAWMEEVQCTEDTWQWQPPSAEASGELHTCQQRPGHQVWEALAGHLLQHYLF